MRLNHFRTGEGPPLVLIHGLGSQWQIWQPVIGTLAREREVIALDLPGFGASSMPPAGTPAGAESLASIVSEFFGELGLERPHVAGNSLGGWISLELARRGTVASATALSPAGFHNHAEAIYQRALLRTARASSKRLAARAESLVATATGRRIALGQFMAHPERLSAIEAAQGIRALGGCQWFDETLEALLAGQFEPAPNIDLPVTIAWGARDRLLLPRQAPRALERIPGARLLMLEGCGHAPTYDDPELVAKVLLEGSAV